ncbi:MAG: tyrosine-type recombinase/integrase [Candidatus Thiodiazotropha endolucinida]|nr:phage integrase N-terminal SAM-like domain-containing protein [Candidatus Thiodiazotropha taylori]MCW4250834.1 phage integrase N-terminal SAM-like domain-containing protein [Candidatus Thiodiazotropha endolucinida]MCG8040097.1 phage integrase N-terminal SAM-like domain-containing protein [Candidatus Thiodiazotropha taylori]MCG8104552.1 phage integrase N-terminal SAM-like domain-containing protein [Candidatus Thiodiazotropha taylori]MCG8121828.1 phage integrase N-terminal SAM-like domain-cont
MSEITVQNNNSLSLVSASSDEEIIILYMAQTDDQGRPRFSERTLESYRRDIKRLVVYLDGKRFPSLTLEDVHNFIDWLKEPPSHLIDEDCRRPINHPDWKPFYKSGLSPSALRQQLASIKAFFRWMSDTGYINKNPFGLLKSSKPQTTKAPKRQLYKEDLYAVLTYLTATEPLLEGKTLRKLARQRWLWFGYLLSGLRISELINHNTGHIYSEVVNGEKVWMFAVTGKGRHEPEPHPIPDGFMEELWRYRESMELEPWPKTPAPLVLSLSGRNAMASRSSAHNEFKDLIQQAALFQDSQGNYDSAARLNTASTHWLRHSFVTSLLDITSDIPAVSNLARHRDIKTTMGYDHSELQALKGLLNDYANSVRRPSSTT